VQEALPPFADCTSAYLADIHVEGTMPQISKEAACWTRHGAYEKGHRCRWTDRGARRMKTPPHMTEWKDEPKVTREDEMKQGLIEANKFQVPLHYDPKEPAVVDILVVDNGKGNIELFKEVYKQEYGVEPGLYGHKALEFGDPKPYMAAGVHFLLGKQSTLLCCPFVASCAGTCFG